MFSGNNVGYQQLVLAKRNALRDTLVAAIEIFLWSVSCAPRLCL